MKEREGRRRGLDRTGGSASHPRPLSEKKTIQEEPSRTAVFQPCKRACPFRRTLLATVKEARGSFNRSCLWVEMLEKEKMGRPFSSTANPTMADAGYPAKGEEACEFVPKTPNPVE